MIESVKWHKKQLMKLLSDSEDFYKIEIELDNVIEKAEKGQRTELRPVKRGGKVFQRKTRVGTKDDNISPKEQIISPKEQMKTYKKEFGNVNPKTLQFNQKVMQGLRSNSDKDFLKTFSVITSDVDTNNIPDKVWNLIENRLRKIPDKDKSHILESLNLI